MKRVVGLMMFLLIAFVATSAQAQPLIPSASWGLGGGNPYWNDYDIYLGVYDSDNATSLWSQRLAYSHNSSDGDPHSGVVDLSAASDYLSGHRWYLLVDDNWGANASYIQTFQIATAFGTFGASGLPIYVPDNAARYAYIDIPDNGDDQGGSSVPEPATMALFGLGSAGLAFVRRKKA